MSKYKAVWSDGYVTNIVLDKGNYRLEGNRRTFGNIEDLQVYYKGVIKSMRLI